jgi:hypothetical protein
LDFRFPIADFQFWFDHTPLVILSGAKNPVLFPADGNPLDSSLRSE